MKEKIFCTYCSSVLTVKYVNNIERLFCINCNIPIYENPIPATAGVLFDSKGRILLVKRKYEPKKNEWCLPGGFIEMGETPKQCCLRELKEETGLDGDINELIDVTLSKSEEYNSVIVAGYSIKDFKGKIKSGDDAQDALFFDIMEKPELAFSSHNYLFKKALENLNVKENRKLLKLKNFGAYIITSQDHILIADKAVKAGAKIIQYRDKQNNKKKILKNAFEIRKLTKKNNTLFIVNDFLDIALLSGADGVHLGQNDIPIKYAREITPNGFIIGKSTHSLEQAKEARKNGADYIGIGPVFQTPTKENYKPIGIDRVREVVNNIDIPVVAIGGLTLNNISILREVGIRNFAMVREFQKNTEQVVKKINEKY